MHKKILALIFLLAFITTVFSAQTITSYIVPNSIALNDTVTATGIYNDTNGDISGQLCHFFFFNQYGVQVYRATSQYTTPTGRFAMNAVKLTEPTFVRDQNYVLETVCVGATADSNFSVVQTEQFFGWYPQSLALDLLYFTNQENAMFFFFGIIILLALTVAISWVVWRVWFAAIKRN